MLHLLRNAKALALAGLLIGGTAIGIAHNRALDRGGSFLPEDAVRVVIKPLQVFVSGAGRLATAAATSLRPRRAILKENEGLREQVRSLTMETARLREEAAEAKRLRSALDFKESSPENLLAARFISRNPSEWFVTATIDRGRMSGVGRGMAVITYRGLVGQVFESSPTSAQVRGITENASGVGAMVQRSRVTGVCRGQGSELLLFTSLARDADIKEGDVIVTSGQGGIVPKGVPVGRVVKVQMESGGFMKSASVRPSVRFDSVEEVFVVMRQVS